MMNKTFKGFKRNVKASEGKAINQDTRLNRFVNLLAEDTLSTSYAVYKNDFFRV